MKVIEVKNHLSPQPKTNPQFSIGLKLKNKEEIILACPKATRALLACMDMEAVLGGAASHWGGPAAFAELMSVLYGLVFFKANKEKKNWYELFHLINDAGHCENGIYALKANYQMSGLNLEALKKFRSIDSPLTGHGEVHLFPESVYLSNGPLGSTLAQAQGLAMADKQLGSKKTCVVTISDGACMEGEVKESFAAIPGFAKKNKLNPFLMIISDNNTKLSGRIDEDSYSLDPTFQSLSSLGWDLVCVEEGHNLEILLEAIDTALKKVQSNPQKPVALRVKTIKGFGVQSSMESSSGGHGFPLKNTENLQAFIEEIYAGSSIPQEILTWCQQLQTKKKRPSRPSDFKKIQVGVDTALIEKKEQDYPIVSISSDLYGSTGVAGFRKKFPDSSFDVGVAEANMVSVAAGFSKQGFIPVVDTFAQFAITKGSLPLIMSALSQAPMIAVLSHVGFQDAADGASHQALSYIAKTFSIPNTEVYSLSCSSEGQALVSQALDEFYQQRKQGKIPSSKIFFLGREIFPIQFSSKPVDYKLRKAQVLDFSDNKNPSVLIVSHGSLVYEAVQAAEQLKKEGKQVVVINNSSVSDPDIETIGPWLDICKGRLVTAEDHQHKGGASSFLVSELVRHGKKIDTWKALDVKGQIGRSAYSANDLYAYFGLDSASIKKATLSLLKN